MNGDRARQALLFGSLAHRLGVLDVEATARAVGACVNDPARPVVDVVRTAGACGEDGLRRLVATADDLLAAHRDDLTLALAAAPIDRATRVAIGDA